jgi:hypothetical protein
VKTLTFASEIEYTGAKVYLPVQLVAVRRLHRIEMVLDTGSEISLLNRRFVAPLGLDLTAGESISRRVASGEIAQAWIHPVEIEVLGRGMTTEAAFCPDWDTQNLLGMRGFFDQMVIAFEHAQRRIYV